MIENMLLVKQIVVDCKTVFLYHRGMCLYESILKWQFYPYQVL